MFNGTCPSRSVLEHVTAKWAVLVLVSLQDGPLRFSALHRAVDGVSEKMLAQTLRTLAGDGLVDRAVTPTTPPQVSYALSGAGRELTVHLFGLLEWIEMRMPTIAAARAAAGAPGPESARPREDAPPASLP